MLNLKKRLFNTLHLFYLSMKKFYDEDYTYKASALAYTTLLSLVPLIAFFVYLVTFFPIFEKVSTLARDYLIANFVPTSREIIISYFTKFTSQASQMPILGILFLFFTTLMLVLTVESTIGQIWHKNRKNNLILIIVDALFIIAAPFLVGLSELFSTFLVFLLKYSHSIEELVFVIPLLTNTIIFTILYYIIPKAKINWKDALAGGIVCAVLFSLIKAAFAIYIQQYSTYALIYGTFAIIPVFLIWLYVFWCIILYGALIVHIRFQQRKTSHKS